jgi:Domain of unknown function (DUF1735)/F5/8 type C domain
MRTLPIIIFYSLLVLITACSKDNAPAPLPDSSVSFLQAADKDSLEMPLSILKDSAVVTVLKAVLSGSTASADHWVNFAIDTTKLAAFRTRYGNAILLPSSSYFFYKPLVRIAAGTSVSEPAQLNVGQQTKLKEYTTYVLPVVIQSVDGQIEGAAASRILYLVFKTGKPLFISKEGWTIADFSSSYNASVPANLIDNDDLNTYWASNITAKMPQWVTISFNKEVTYTSLNYYLPPLLRYPANGGYPTSIQIETSMDGTNWVSKGVFKGQIENNMQTINTGLTTGRYLRFTSLASVKYASAYEAIFISGISLVP